MVTDSSARPAWIASWSTSSMPVRRRAWRRIARRSSSPCRFSSRSRGRVHEAGMLEARGLFKSFGKVAAVRGVSFTARDGQITGLLGPNGAGKSTTLRMLYTVLKPDQGDALIDGRSVLEDPLAARRAIGVLSHGAGVYNRLTARETIASFGELPG